MNILEKIKEAINSKQLVEISAHLNDPQGNPQGLSNRKCIPLDIRGETVSNPKFLFYDLDSPQTEHFLQLPLNKLYNLKLLAEKFNPAAMGLEFKRNFKRNWETNADAYTFGKMQEFCKTQSIVQLIFRQNSGQVSKRYVIAHKIDSDPRLKAKIYGNYKSKFESANKTNNFAEFQNLLKNFQAELAALPLRFHFMDLDSPDLEHYLSILPEGVVSIEKALASDFYKIKLPDFAGDREKILEQRRENLVVRGAKNNGIDLDEEAKARQIEHEKVLETVLDTAKKENKLIELDVHSISHGRIKRIVSYLGKNNNGAEGCYVFEDLNSPDGEHIAQFNKYQIEDARILDISKPAASIV